MADQKKLIWERHGQNVWLIRPDIVTGIKVCSVITDLLKSSLHDEEASVTALLCHHGQQRLARKWLPVLLNHSHALKWKETGDPPIQYIQQGDVIHSLKLTVRGTAATVVIIHKLYGSRWDTLFWTSVWVKIWMFHISLIWEHITYSSQGVDVQNYWQRQHLHFNRNG